MKNALLVIIFMLFGSALYAQSPHRQVVRGQVLDADTRNPMPGANVVVVDSEPLIGTTTDAQGYFELQKVAAGRASLKVSFIGYHSKLIENIYVSAAKELVMEIPLKEKAISMKAVEIKANTDKRKPVNKLASVSARKFTVEESQRFAGARNDVARMASNYAGVATPNDAENGIVIRGNSPNGLLWMLEGVEIPNPNHFGAAGASGGPVGMINNNVLANSDFMTGAFPAEYGNALSGVFELQMRNGNYQEHEFTGQIGFNGVEVGAEGPINREINASYLANYRYSTLSVLKELGFNFGTGAAIPFYQDLNFKVNIPTRKRGTFSVFGVAGKNHISFVNDSQEEGSDYYGADDFNLYNENHMATTGLKHSLPISKQASLQTIYSFSSVWQSNTIDSVSSQGAIFEDFIKNNLRNNYHTLRTTLTYKITKQNLLKTGGTLRLLNYDFRSEVWRTTEQDYEQSLFAQGNTLAYKSFVHWQWQPSSVLTFNSGFHLNALTYTGSAVIEPRLGIRYQLAPGHTLSAAYGRHSKLLPVQFYMQQTEVEEGLYRRTNANLSPAKANHYVLGYNWNITPFMRMKAEAYYQSLYDVPVEQDPSSFSVLNLSSMTFVLPDSLVNDGTGTNYGVELTLERFMHKGSYFLFTASLFDSKYTGSDGVKRATLFDSDYVINLLGGKEWELSPKHVSKMMWLLADLRLTAAGGKRYTPVDVEESLAEGDTRYDADRVYALQYDPYFRADFRVAFRMESSKISQEWAIDVQNVTNNQNPFYQRFNLDKQQTETVYQLGLMPIMQYKIYF